MKTNNMLAKCKTFKFRTIKTYNDMKIVDVSDIQRAPVLLTRLFKWQDPTEAEMAFFYREWKRISADQGRVCIAVMSLGKVSLYVDDLTGGEFDKLGDRDG